MVHVGKIIKRFMTSVNGPVQLIMYEEGGLAHSRNSKESMNERQGTQTDGGKEKQIL